MTIDEAMLAIEEDKDYVVYRDAQTDKVSVLVRRRDGKVDLIEADPLSMAKKSKRDEKGPGESTVRRRSPELVVITGLSGSGKGTVLKALEDLGFYAVDHLPLDLIQTFAELTKDSPNIRRAALVVDIREGEQLRRFRRFTNASGGN